MTTKNYFKLKTTGINPQKDLIYQAILYNPSKKIKKHFFLSRLDQEVLFLQDLSQSLPNCLTTFRGQQFDLRFLATKLQAYGLASLTAQVDDLWDRQKALLPFVDFPATTLKDWHYYYKKEKPLSVKAERQLVESYYTSFNLKDKTKLFLSLEEQIQWFPLFEKDLSIQENKLNLDPDFCFKSIAIQGNSLIYQGVTSYLPIEIYKTWGNLEIKDGLFSLEIPLLKGKLLNSTCYYSLENDVSRESYPDIPLPSHLIIVFAENKFQTKDMLKLAKNRLKKLLVLP